MVPVDVSNVVQQMALRIIIQALIFQTQLIQNSQ